MEGDDGEFFGVNAYIQHEGWKEINSREQFFRKNCSLFFCSIFKSEDGAAFERFYTVKGDCRITARRNAKHTPKNANHTRKVAILL